MKHLDDAILELLIKKTGKKEGTVRKNISLIRRRYPSATLNACGQVYAQQHGTSVLQKLDKEDKQSLPFADVAKPITIRVPNNKPARKAAIIFGYPSSQYFIRKHIEEINRAYNSTCLTSAYILIRKVFENLVIDILRTQFPPTSLDNKELYFDTTKARYKDFSVILRNFYDKRADFPTGLKKAIERLYTLTKNLKDEANDKAHSLYHIVTKKKELEDLDLPTIVELTMEIEKKIGLRT